MFSPENFTSVLNSYLPEPHASLLNGILFGENLKTSKIFYEEVKRVGLLHLVVLSGTNITILSSIIGSLTKNLSKSISILINILIIILFTIFVGAKAPIIRAAIMSIITLVAVLYGRKSAALYSLFISFVLISLFKPEWIGTISLQLSYGASLGIILFGTVHERKKECDLVEKIKFTIWKELKPSLAAQVFTAPLIFFWFKQVSFIAPLPNILVAFLIGPLMVFGFLASVLGRIHFILGIIPAYICYGLLSYMIFVIKLLSKVPFGYMAF